VSAARSADVQLVNGPGIIIPIKLGGKVLQGTTAEHDLFDAEFDLRRNGCRRYRGHKAAQRRKQSQRLGVRIRRGKPVRVELPRGEHRMQQRRGAEADVRRA
jgi:hypothetical protein